MMIDRLHDVLPSLEHLSPEAQEEAATYIEALAEVLQRVSIRLAQSKTPTEQETLHEAWQDPFGAWSDLPETMFDTLEQLRHENPPTPPLELP